MLMSEEVKSINFKQKGNKVYQETHHLFMLYNALIMQALVYILYHVILMMLY